MRENQLKHHLQAGGTALCGWLQIASSRTAEVMAHLGWAAVAVDVQHGLVGTETAIQMLQAISATAAVPLVRTRANDPGEIMALLDGGAYGVICPMINTAAECAAFVGACRYPPLGYRSYGPTRAAIYAGSDYGEHANTELLTLAMIETAEGVANCEAICAVDGLDGIFIGPTDLRLSLTGTLRTGEDDTVFEAALATILDHCRRRGLIAGIWCASVADAVAMQARGFRLIALQSDHLMLLEQAGRQYRALAERIGDL
jgi:4-hydroxy-2-oxoheptanedioate aldolase